jgi:hypothetical protein
MRRLLALAASVLVLGLVVPEPNVSAAETCGVKGCNSNSDCSWTSICNRCTGPDVIAGGRGECKAFGQD